jgi:hypothetical protein
MSCGLLTTERVKISWAARDNKPFYARQKAKESMSKQHERESHIDVRYLPQCPTPNQHDCLLYTSVRPSSFDWVHFP